MCVLIVTQPIWKDKAKHVSVYQYTFFDEDKTIKLYYKVKIKELHANFTGD
jgi:hypothetical protein